MMKARPYRDLKEAIGEPLEGNDAIRLWWLGQAGFALRFRERLILIDPYLSNFLSKMYKGGELAYTRMIPSPILPEDLDHVDLVLATHRHSDHMDPETLPALAKRNPDCQFILPRSERAWAGKIGIPESQTIALNDGEAFVLEDQISINGIASAHEEIRTNQKGEHHFLGYVLGLGPVRIYHSGDCTPYPGLISKIADHKIKLALLPINGRDDYRRRRSIPGNFTVDEAVDLCLRAGVGVLLGHHYGMFSFNTIEEEEAERVLRGPFLKLEGFLARLGLTYVISK